MRADRLRVQQILSNLLTNALKYGATPIRISAERTDGTVEIRVTDSGSGRPGRARAAPLRALRPRRRSPRPRQRPRPVHRARARPRTGRRCPLRGDRRRRPLRGHPFRRAPRDALTLSWPTGRGSSRASVTRRSPQVDAPHVQGCPPPSQELCADCGGRASELVDLPDWHRRRVLKKFALPGQLDASEAAATKRRGERGCSPAGPGLRRSPQNVRVRHEHCTREQRRSQPHDRGKRSTEWRHAGALDACNMDGDVWSWG